MFNFIQADGLHFVSLFSYPLVILYYFIFSIIRKKPINFKINLKKIFLILVTPFLTFILFVIPLYIIKSTVMLNNSSVGDGWITLFITLMISANISSIIIANLLIKSS